MNAMKVGIDQVFSGTFESFLCQKKVKGNNKGVEHFRLLCAFVFAVYTTEDKHLSFIFLVFKSDIRKKIKKITDLFFLGEWKSHELS